MVLHQEFYSTSSNVRVAHQPHRLCSSPDIRLHSLRSPRIRLSLTLALLVRQKSVLLCGPVIRCVRSRWFNSIVTVQCHCVSIYLSYVFTLKIDFCFLIRCRFIDLRYFVRSFRNMSTSLPLLRWVSAAIFCVCQMRAISRYRPIADTIRPLYMYRVKTLNQSLVKPCGPI